MYIEVIKFDRAIDTLYWFQHGFHKIVFNNVSTFKTGIKKSIEEQKTILRPNGKQHALLYVFPKKNKTYVIVLDKCLHKPSTECPIHRGMFIERKDFREGRRIRKLSPTLFNSSTQEPRSTESDTHEVILYTQKEGIKRKLCKINTCACIIVQVEHFFIFCELEKI